MTESQLPTLAVKDAASQDMAWRMVNGLPFLPTDKTLLAKHRSCQETLRQINSLAQGDARDELLRGLLGACGNEFRIEGPFLCDYGFNIEFGQKFFANYNLVILDVGKVTIGDNVLIGPNVSIYAVGHAIDPNLRSEGWEFGIPVRVSDNVWLGGSCVITPGASIGANSVIGAGAVVIGEIPSNVVAAGNPAKVIREIGANDRKFYRKDMPYDF